MNLNNSVISAVCFVLTLAAFVGLQFTPHGISSTTSDALFSIMGLALGHALGSSTVSKIASTLTGGTKP